MVYETFYDDIYNFISTEQNDSIRYLSYSVSGLSLFGSFLIILIYLLNNNLRSFSFSLIINLTISVALQDISKLLSIGIYEVPDPHADVLCMIQAYFLNYSQLSALFWSGIISWSLYSTVILLRKKITTDEDRFYLAGFGAPVSISLIPLLSDDYGFYEMGCWISSKQRTIRGTIIRNICYYIPLLLGVIINFYLIKKVSFYVRSALPDDPAITFLNRLQWYPYMLLLILITYLAKLIALFITHNSVVLYIVLIFTTLFANLLGVYNFIIFGYTKSVKEAIIINFYKFLGKKKRESEEVEESAGGENGSNSSNSNSNASEKALIFEDDKNNYFHMNN